MTIGPTTTRPPRAPFEFPRVSGHLSHRGASNEIARVRKHPSPSTRRGNRKGHVRVSGDQWAGAGLTGAKLSDVYRDRAKEG
jgi:hypothetical protein